MYYDETYEELITKLIRSNDEEIIANTGLENYKLAVELIFKNSIFNVNWFVLNEERFNEIYDRKISDAVDAFLKQGGKLTVNIGKHSDNGNFIKCMKRIKDDYPDQFVCYLNERKVTTETHTIFSGTKKTPCEWITFDDKGYRYSPEADKYRAIFSANDKEFVYRLNHMFD